MHQIPNITAQGWQGSKGYDHTLAKPKEVWEIAPEDKAFQIVLLEIKDKGRK